MGPGRLGHVALSVVAIGLFGCVWAVFGAGRALRHLVVLGIILGLDALALVAEYLVLAYRKRDRSAAAGDPPS
ncbi:hypothetical protein GCM10010170_086340 [Dactylosporangium salmoneum]|uniref:Uncharacterized protein n=2 Tax=Dactylosporangium salmoneum TaxID=53361 RepID=A0ABN3HGB5_9ACTN